MVETFETRREHASSATPSADQRRFRATPGLALLIAAVSAATIATVWAVEHAGYVPCELCLAERNPFYGAVPLALLTAWAARSGWLTATRVGFTLLALVFVGSAGLAAYHAGVEWKMWAGPTGCAGALASPTSVMDMMEQLKTVRVVRCDAPALVVFGLSLAGWNVLLSLALAALSSYAARVAWRVPAR